MPVSLIIKDKAIGKPIRVLLTRPAHLAAPLVEKLKTAGFIPELLPLIEFIPPSDKIGLIRKLERFAIADIDIAIFVSVTAVQYGMELMLEVWPKLPTIEYAVVGPATLHALEAYTLPKRAISPSKPPYESESLLENPALQNVRGKKILIFRGNGGRELLAKVLTERGAKVEILECYQRQIPLDSAKNIANRLNIWSQEPPHVILTSSVHSLENLKTLVGMKGWDLLKTHPIVVVGLRMQALATTLGITQVVTAKAADDASLIEALMNLRDNFQ
jgi:uroporphyrinogen-III synthase